MTDTEIPIPVPVPRPTARAAFLPRLLEFVRSHKGAFILSAILVVAIILTGAGTYAVSAQPTFCVSCHELQTAYDQWRTSSHYGVACINCHTEPSLSGILKINLVGAEHLVTHLVSDYHLPTTAAVEDSSCLSCHPRESRPEESLRTTLRVAHSKHDQEQCADCHGRLVHINGTDEISTAPKPHDVRDCTVCHTPANCPHGDATLACTSCHSGNIPKHQAALERGVMPRASCQECHQKNRIGSPEYCQTCHVSPHGISTACSRCHTSKTTWTEHTFNHPTTLTGKHATLTCDKCHANKPLASMKFVCSECHQAPKQHAGTINGKTETCSNCHTPEGWQQVKSAKAQPANHSGRTACLVCHTSLTKPALPTNHQGRADSTCGGCHKLQ